MPVIERWKAKLATCERIGIAFCPETPEVVEVIAEVERLRDALRRITDEDLVDHPRVYARNVLNA